MADVSVGSLVLIALFTGLGSGIGTPFGNWVYKKFLEPRLEKAHERMKEGKLPIQLSEMDTEAKIREMLGK